MKNLLFWTNLGYLDSNDRKATIFGPLIKWNEF